MVPAAQGLFDRAVTDGWAADGHDGFVYTTDWDGTPVVRDRMHWVLAEGICAAAALHDATGDPAYDEHYRTWWDHAATHWVDPDDGSWQHQLTPDLQPADSVWPGRPDTYHSLHAVVLPRLPQAPGAARAVEAGLLDAGPADRPAPIGPDRSRARPIAAGAVRGASGSVIQAPRRGEVR